MASELRRASTEVDAVTANHLLTHRRELHAVPELSFKEFETSRYLVERLDALSPDRLEAGVAGTGIVADVKGARPGRAVLVRADIDGLPIQEAGELAFRSTHRGVMHACGHDVHMAIALEVARALAERRAELSGMVPLAIRGLGGHGAQRQFAVDAVVIAAQIVNALQTLASRETAPAAPIVITLGSVHGGTAANIVAGEVVIQGTLRTLDPALRTHVVRRIAELAEGVATAMRGHCEFKLESVAPPVINDGPVAAMVADAARVVVGEGAVVAFEPLMVG